MDTAANNMKRKLTRGIATNLLLALSVSFTGHAFAACEDETAYQVPPTSFSKLNAISAIGKVSSLAGYTVVDMGLRGETHLSAKDISGPLYAVLDHFVSEYKIEYRVQNCQIRLYAPGKAPNLKSYKLTAGKPIHEEITGWASAEGWKLNWLPDKSWRAFANTSIEDAGAVDAVSKVISYLRAEGKPVRLRVYGGNRVMEVESTDIRGN